MAFRRPLLEMSVKVMKGAVMANNSRLAETNRATLGKAIAWVKTRPWVVVSLLALTWRPLQSLLHSMIHLGSMDFERKQEAKAVRGEERTFRVLELYLGNDVQRFWASMNKLFHEVSPGLPSSARTCYYRCLMFRLLSRSASATHQIFDVKHKCSPFVLFGCLWGLVSDLEQLPPCLYDELTATLLGQFSSCLAFG